MKRRNKHKKLLRHYSIPSIFHQSIVKRDIYYLEVCSDVVSPTNHISILQVFHHEAVVHDLPILVVEI